MIFSRTSLAIILPLLFTASLQAAEQEQLAPVQGVVVADGRPVEDATVTLRDAYEDKTYSATTASDVNGVFLFFDVPNAALKLTILKSGFIEYETPVNFAGTPVRLTAELRAGQKSYGKLPPTIEPPADEWILYATDREPSGNSTPDRFFRNARSDGTIYYGQAHVTVPEVSTVGAMSTEEILAMGTDRVSDVMLVELKPSRDRTEFLQQVTAEGRGKEALVFVHGFANSFEYAARRLGALKHDLKFSGPAILYSWASKNSVGAYSDDEATSEWSSPHFNRLLEDLSKAGITKVHLLAHSMGNRLVLRGLQSCNATNVGQVIFTAPDVDADTFHEALGVINRFGDRITEYANDKDRALQISALKHGFPRAGQLAAAIGSTGTDVIDATQVDTSLQHHSYFVDSPQVVSDITQVLSYAKLPRPNTLRLQQGQYAYWQLQR